ncbi:MAG: glycosyltransferase family 39 protein [Bacteroidaceae bacterium]|nr:glycosyltransferase family 39 protein [Bacteroidaceae bacterium]
MKANSILQIIKNGNQKEQLRLLYCIALLNLTVILLIFRINWLIDSPTYYSAGTLFLHGQIDEVRTPVYSIICALASCISTYHVWVIVFLQCLLYLLSIAYLYKLSTFFIQKKHLQFIATAVYACLPCFSAWILCILTESIALSLAIIFTYYILRYIRFSKIKDAVISNTLFAVLLMLRPSFIFLLPILIVLSLILIIQKRKHCFINLCGLLIVFGFYLSYCYTFKQQYGVFSTSSVGYVNQIEILRRGQLLDYSELNSSTLQTCSYIDSTGVQQLDSFKIRDLSTTIEKDRIFKSSLKNNQKEYVILNLHKFIHLGSEPCFLVYANSRIEVLGGLLIRSTKSLSITFMMMYVILIIYIFLLFKNIKQGNMPLLSAFLWLYIIGMFVTAIAGAQSDYSRLILPCTPFIIICFFQLWDKLIEFTPKDEVLE